MKDSTNLKNLNDSQAENVKTLPDTNQHLIKITDDIQEPFPLFAINYHIIASHGNLLVIKAKQKAGKTFLICILAAAYHSGKYISVQVKEKKGLFLWVDSEQSKSQVFKVLKRMFKMAGLTPFTDEEKGIYYLSELTVDERWEIIEMLAANPECEVLAVDVVTDFVHDPNDLKETKAAADRLQAIAKKNNIVIIATIHENKLNDHATGHLGSALMKKAETVLTLEKRDTIFTVSSPYARHGEPDSFSFIIDEHGLPIEANAPVMMTKTDKLEYNIKLRFKKILALKRLCHTDLKNLYMDSFGVSDKTACNHITRALEMETIDVDNKYYSLKTDESEDE